MTLCLFNLFIMRITFFQDWPFNQEPFNGKVKSIIQLQYYSISFFNNNNNNNK